MGIYECRHHILIVIIPAILITGPSGNSMHATYMLNAIIDLHIIVTHIIIS